MTINLKMPDIHELKPRITVFGVGGAGGNAVNNMITTGLQGVDFVVANTDAQALALSKAERIIQMGVQVTEGLGAGSQPDIGRAAAEEVIDEIRDHLSGSHMCFVTAGMGGGTGTGAAPVVASTAREMGILTVGVVTKPFHFEGVRRMRTAEAGIQSLQACVDTLIVIPNQNLFRVATERTGFADAFAMADQVLYQGVACITDLMVKEGLINLDFADVRAVMREMGKAMMGTGEAEGERRAVTATEQAISNPLLDEVSMRGAKGLLISITGGKDLTLYEVDEAATRIREEVDPDANIIVGATLDPTLDGVIRVSVVATGIDAVAQPQATHTESKLAESAPRMRSTLLRPTERAEAPAPMMEAPSIQPAPVVEVPAPMLDPVQSIEPEVTIDEVELRPIAPKPSFFLEAAIEEHVKREVEERPAETFIPPMAERPMAPRPARVPRIEDLPPQTQEQLRAPRIESNEHHSAEKKRMTLLQRLAAVGLGRREEEDVPAEARPVVRQAQPAPQQMQQRPAMPPVNEYAKRPMAPQPQQRPQAPQQNMYLDPHGRPAPRPAAMDEEHYDIPAFLRRQSNS